MTRVLLAAVAVLMLTACKEIPQDARKPYAGKEDVQPYANDRFKGDKQAYEKAMAKRADYQNEYLRTGEAKKVP